MSKHVKASVSAITKRRKLVRKRVQKFIIPARAQTEGAKGDKNRGGDYDDDDTYESTRGAHKQMKAQMSEHTCESTHMRAHMRAHM